MVTVVEKEALLSGGLLYCFHFKYLDFFRCLEVFKVKLSFWKLEDAIRSHFLQSMVWLWGSLEEWLEPNFQSYTDSGSLNVTALGSFRNEQ